MYEYTYIHRLFNYNSRLILTFYTFKVKDNNQIARKTNHPMHHALGIVRNISHHALNFIGTPFKFIGGAFHSLRNSKFFFIF